MRIKPILTFIRTNIIIAVIFITTMLLIMDFSNYTLTEDWFESTMEAQDVVASANIQGSRVYVTREQGGYFAHMFEIASVTNRFRALWTLDITETNLAVVLGRLHHFRVMVSDEGAITFYRYTGNLRTLNSRRHLQLVAIGLLLGFSASWIIVLRGPKRS